MIIDGFLKLGHFGIMEEELAEVLWKAITYQ
jgi:hypothetical protein